MNCVKNVRTGNKNCCVVNCPNKYQNTLKDVTFYTFPGRPWEKEVRDKWIQAVNRVNPDGTRWLPNGDTRICSQHFIGNRKSQHPTNPSYLPTIFPAVYKVPPLTESQRSRFERVQKRTASTPSTAQNLKRARDTIPAVDCDPTHMNVHDEMPKYRDVGTQTDPIIVTSNPSENSAPCDTMHATKPRPTMVDKEVSAVEGSTTNGPGTFLYCSGFHGYFSIQDDESAMVDLTGVTLAVFLLLLRYLPDSLDRKICKENRLLLFLIKMKTGFTYSALRVLFGIHRTTAASIFKTVLTHLTAATQAFIFWPSKLSVQRTMPHEFKDKYPDCRVIIDCSEIRVEQPKEVNNRIYFYSNYKSTFTMKFLIGITPSGMVSFISKCYGGRSSDSSITVDSNLLDLLEPGDDVMADKGFPGIKTMLEDKHCIIVMPPFLHNGRFSEEEVDQTYRVASVRIHVERMIQRVKIYNILQKVPVELFPHIDDIVRMCCVLANLQMPIIKNI